ncbi:MAG: S-methyl-5'-thioinosine phosphorylase [Woeseiaceae bacterium]
MAGRATQYAIIAGSGFRSFGGAGVARTLLTRYGRPSAPVRQLDFGRRAVYFLARHGADHSIPPHRINYRANLGALKLLGVDQVIALNTVGVLDPQRFSGLLAVPHQVIDYTYGRVHSIHDGNSASLDHIDFTEPFCPRLRQGLIAAATAAGVPCHAHGVYAVTEGPRLESAAEINRLEKDGADLVGMTAMPEASIARELGMSYACLSLLVNHAAGRGETAIHEDINANTEAAKTDALCVLRAFFGSDELQGAS